jgi:hypothetical protein
MEKSAFARSPAAVFTQPTPWRAFLRKFCAARRVYPATGRRFERRNRLRYATILTVLTRRRSM